ncbi:hypothetical protein HBH64_162040 [Parastagonospora nodorum]|nr:hypothetical protein HBH49_185580 [Parastagonospora nodorum]KAH4182930.1 hypothetical protein HBH42_211530 [Parastagonospora nodorum]KAH4222944.1 hypothetical protein HBI06_137330 [Parastagonospora nodorum]KAH4240690.1 hypothetical protein HBI05_111410 [Parastagonospora nodorum]KAH4294176.1 hypothetical protein HBI01_166960 [Parastagonospora nodorum]
MTADNVVLCLFDYLQGPMSNILKQTVNRPGKEKEATSRQWLCLATFNRDGAH